MSRLSNTFLIKESYDPRRALRNQSQLALQVLKAALANAEKLLNNQDQIGAANEIREQATELDLILNRLANELVNTTPQKGAGGK